MIDIDFKRNKKQGLAYLCLMDKKHRSIGYGGGAGGGKSYLGCVWVVSNCLQYPGTTYVIGRKELTTLKKTTMMTLLQVIVQFEQLPEEDYKYNQQLNIITFNNGSKIILLDMAYKPSDPEYLRFGGLELTGAFVDESNECDLKAIEILQTRIGRGLNDAYGIYPKVFETFNPSKNHVHQRFWQPFKNNTMPEGRVFIRALATDNTYLSPMYIAQLEQADDITRQRLLLGNFDYDDDDRALVNYDRIMDSFTNDFVNGGAMYIVSDIAMQGRDNFVVTVWNGLRCRFETIKGKATAKEIEEDILNIAKKYNVPRSNIIADSDGIGAYLGSYVEGIKQFMGGSKAPNSTKYVNLKNQCAFKLAELLNEGKIYIENGDKLVTRAKSVKDILSEEMAQLKIKDVDNEGRREIIHKSEMKQNIGRSPDLLDCLIMRMFFELAPKIVPLLGGGRMF